MRTGEPIPCRQVHFIIIKEDTLTPGDQRNTTTIAVNERGRGVVAEAGKGATPPQPDCRKSKRSLISEKTLTTYMVML